MKTTLAAAAFALAFALAAFGVSHANRPVELHTLENLQALDRAEDSTAKAAMTWVNNNALDHLPVAATLRVEDAIAGLVIEQNDSDAVVVASN